MNSQDIRTRIKKCTLEQLSALRAFTLHDPPIITTKIVSEATSTTDDPKAMGGIISSLARIKTDQGNLIEPSSRNREEGILWRLNENVIPRKELAELVDQIMTEVQKIKWQKLKA